MKKFNHKSVYEKHSSFIESKPFLKRALHPASHALTAIYFIFYAWLLYTAFKETYTSDKLIRIIGAPVLCLIIVTVLRFAVARPRPYSENGANVTPIAKKKSSADNSFPSRHVACAFVISTLLLPFATGLGIALLVFACVLSYVRFALGLHYLSDIFGGAGIGLACGLLIFI